MSKSTSAVRVKDESEGNIIEIWSLLETKSKSVFVMVALGLSFVGSGLQTERVRERQMGLSLKCST